MALSILLLPYSHSILGRMRDKLHIIVIATLSILVHPGAFAQEPTEISRYEDCMGLAIDKPAEALNIALLWQENAGGAPARHCEAISLFNLAEYGEAGARFELIAEDIRVGRGMPTIAGTQSGADKVIA